MRVDLICLGDAGQPAPFWPLGETRIVPATVSAVAAAAMTEIPPAPLLPRSPAAFLFWDAAFGAPNAQRVAALLNGPGDVWHAGLALGMGGLPRLIDFVDPVWRFNRDPRPDIVAVSWRLSLRACLARAEVLRALGGPDAAFDTLAGAALELGHRWIVGGAMMRHVAGLVGGWTTDDGRRPTAVGRRTTDDGRRPTADRRRTTADGQPPTADGRSLITDLLTTDLLTTDLLTTDPLTTDPLTTDLLTTDPLTTHLLPPVPLADEFRFVRRRYGRVWAAWAGLRAVRHGASPVETARAWQAAGVSPGAVVASAALHAVDDGHSPRATRSASEDADSAAALATRHAPRATRSASEDADSAAALATRHAPLATPAPLLPRSPAPLPPSVTVLIPTLDRYPHLFVLLNHLRAQTVPPLEIIVVDQTAAEERDETWPARFADLPLRVIWRDTAGQCSSRNAGLAAARGDAVLFLDDDDEIPPDLIARHLAYLERFGVDASCGVAEELGAGALPAAFRLVRDSDVFPTNNALLRRDALADAGLFDLAYERGERADGDLGMRLYLAGKTLGLNPGAAVLHLHAPRGGLRQHRARVVTRGGSRGSLRSRHLLAPTEGYLWERYFTAEQAHEALLIRSVGTLRGDGNRARRLLRAALMAVLLPDTWRQNRARLAQGRTMLDRFPAIPAYEPLAAEELIPT